jgi:type VI secretion system secreted protein VgrG
MTAATFLRDHALMSMTSPLGANVLVPTALELEEGLSEPFLCTLDMVSARQSIDPNDLLHQPVCVTLRSNPDASRKVHGLVRRFAATGARERGMFGYRAEVVPALWFLSQTQDCRIFENKSTKDILQTVLSEHGLKVSFRASAPPVRPFTVQYNEDDLAFVSRLMEEDGWFYWFLHDESGHTLVVSDSTGSFVKIPGGPFEVRPGDAVSTLAAWDPAEAVTSGKIMMADFDPERPSTQLQGATSTTLTAGGAATRDPFHWPARALTSDAINKVTRLRMEAAEVSAFLSRGAGFNPAFVVGGRIKVIDRRGADPREYLLARVSHKASDDTWRNTASPPSYSNRFTTFPATMPWRPGQTTPRPRMEGIYSAVVIGPNGQEIHTDELGRVKVRFRWDRRKDATAGGAIWVRVMQAWAGANGGWSFIPRVGTEVAVAFMDGDPDRPVVVGQLHNGDQLPPWPLPDQKTRGGLRTRSTPGGLSEQYSEFSFDDTKGAEQVFIHAERDLKVEVEHDAAYTIDNDRNVTIKQGNDTLTLQQGNRTVDVTDGNHVIKSTNGDISIKTALGAISIEAMKSLTLKVGQSSITLDQSGISIKGLKVQIEGQIMSSLKAALVQLNAHAALKVAGGLIMLN